MNKQTNNQQKAQEASKQNGGYLHCLHQRIAARLIQSSANDKQRKELIELASR